ncbi:TIGR03773 family transporter-associated surface protein [Kribbella koreensis]
MTPLFLLPLAITSMAAAPAPPDAQVVIADGHVDLGPRFVDGKWTIQLRDDTADPVVWRPLENVVVQATGKAELSVPADPAYAFLGKTGQKIWVIPQVQQPGVVWPGWNTQDPEVAKRVDREVTWKLNGVDGPGTFTLFLNSDFGKPAPVFDSRKPYPQETGIDVNTHVHGNWTFSAAGTYLLDITMTANLTDGTTVTDRRPLRLHAGPGDARDAFKTTTIDEQAPSSSAGGGRGRDVAVAGFAVLLAVGVGFAVRLLVRRKRATA